MSRLQIPSETDILDMDGLRIEEISSSNSIFIKSYKRNNTKTWYKDENEEKKNNTNNG